MISEKESDADMERLKKATNELGKHFDTVQIFVTRHAPEHEGTIRICWGSGNWFARYGQVTHWKVKEDDVVRSEVRRDE